MENNCEHKFIFKGLVYSNSTYSLPGSGAHARRYEDSYFCEKCLLNIHNNVREIGNSYEKPLPGSIPK